MAEPVQERTTSGASLVLLLRGLEDMDNPVALRNVVRRHFHTKLPICRGEGGERSEFLAVSFPDLVIQFDGFRFHILAVPEPFFTDRASVAAQMDELRLRQAVLDHEAYVRITLVDHPAEMDANEIECMLGKMTAVLGGSAATLAVATPLHELRLWDRNIRRALRSENPETALRETPLSKVPVLPSDADDADLQAATAEARRRWPQFTNAYANKRPEQIFAVKVPFREGEFTEFMWIKILKIKGEFLQGVLDNDPVNLKRFKRGTRVRLRVRALTDWMYTEGERRVGGFTNEALNEARREREARNLEEHERMEKSLTSASSAEVSSATVEGNTSTRLMRHLLEVGAVVGLLCGLGIGLTVWRLMH